MKIFVIHYKKLHSRKKDIIEQFEKYNFTNYEFIEHYDRDELTDEDKQNFEEGYKPCQIAITLSHLYAYKEIAAKYQGALILEDDAILHDNFIELFNSYIDQLPCNFDMFFIGHGCNLHIPQENINSNCNVYKKQETRCTDSYVITTGCAQKIINYFNNMAYKINSPVDFWLNTVLKDLDLEVYWAEPHIVVQGTMVGKYLSSHLYDGAIIF
jgi:glycosyl transferase family 25